MHMIQAWHAPLPPFVTHTSLRMHIADAFADLHSTVPDMSRQGALCCPARLQKGLQGALVGDLAAHADG